jgi:restriction system protein
MFKIQAFACALDGHRNNKGIFITASDFTKDAEEYSEVIF